MTHYSPLVVSAFSALEGFSSHLWLQDVVKNLISQVPRASAFWTNETQVGPRRLMTKEDASFFTASQCLIRIVPFSKSDVGSNVK